MKKTITWVVVADGQKARVLINDGPNHGLKEDKSKTIAFYNPANRDQVTDRPGRFPDAGSTQISAAEPADPHRQEKENFARVIADKLRQAALKKEYDRLILIAAPKTLGDLRSSLDKNVTEYLHAEIDSDLTHHTPKDIEKHVEKVLAV